MNNYLLDLKLISCGEMSVSGIVVSAFCFTQIKVANRSVFDTAGVEQVFGFVFSGLALMT